jgi:hypothetical protein
VIYSRLLFAKGPMNVSADFNAPTGLIYQKMENILSKLLAKGVMAIPLN